MMGVGLLEARRPRRGARARTGLRAIGFLVLGCTAASATALLLPQPEPRAGKTAQRPRAEVVQAPLPAAPAKIESKLAATMAELRPTSADAVADQPVGRVRQIPLINGVDPTPPTAPKTSPAPARPQAATQPAAALVAQLPAAHEAPVTAPVIASAGKAPVDCLPEELRTVLQDVQARFGPVEVVSTRELHTDNHSPGSTRHKLHAACKAVDFKVAGDVNAVTAFLRARPEVAGVNAYRNNRVLHVDVNDSRRVAAR